MSEWEARRGAAHEEEEIVTPEKLASAVGSGEVPVYATPCLAALMEKAARILVQPWLEEGITTVGTALQLTHTAATPEGAAVRARAELIEADGRRFVFRITASDEAGSIGECIHERCTVKTARFLEKAQARRK